VKDIINGGGKSQKDTMIRWKINEKEKIMPLIIHVLTKSHTPQVSTHHFSAILRPSTLFSLHSPPPPKSLFHPLTITFMRYPLLHPTINNNNKNVSKTKLNSVIFENYRWFGDFEK